MPKSSCKMSVKSSFTFLKDLNMSRLFFSGAIVLILVSALIYQSPDDKYEDKQLHLAVRAIGDELLRYNHNEDTPVPPVFQKSSDLRLSFDFPIEINPDSLSLSALRFLTPEIAKQAIVNVYSLDSDEMVYGFEIDHQKENIIPCLGRVLPKANYEVGVTVQGIEKNESLTTNFPSFSTAGASLLFIILGFSFLKSFLEQPSIGC